MVDLSNKNDKAKTSDFVFQTASPVRRRFISIMQQA